MLRNNAYVPQFSITVLTLTYTGSEITRLTRGIRSNPLPNPHFWPLIKNSIWKRIYGCEIDTFVFIIFFLKSFVDPHPLNLSQKISILKKIKFWKKSIVEYCSKRVENWRQKQVQTIILEKTYEYKSCWKFNFTSLKCLLLALWTKS